MGLKMDDWYAFLRNRRRGDLQRSTHISPRVADDALYVETYARQELCQFFAGRLIPFSQPLQNQYVIESNIHRHISPPCQVSGSLLESNQFRGVLGRLLGLG